MKRCASMLLAQEGSIYSNGADEKGILGILIYIYTLRNNVGMSK